LLVTPRGSHLDHEAVWAEVNFKGRMIEVADFATFATRRERLEDAPVPADAVRCVARP
jgi:hypothetical protein